MEDICHISASFEPPCAVSNCQICQVILRMNNVSFTYPTKDKPTIMDVSLTVSQVSRVAVIGANGAGKSTAIKVLVGEQLPGALNDGGFTWLAFPMDTLWSYKKPWEKNHLC
jgi:ABC-type transport system involved in cytochrome bd biosynthesis fused ATPase/permease subunit